MNRPTLQLRQNQPSTHETVVAFTEWLLTVPELTVGKEAPDNAKIQQLAEQFLHENCLTDYPLDYDAISYAIKQMDDVPLSVKTSESFHSNGYTIEKQKNENGMTFYTLRKDGEKVLQPVYIEYKIDEYIFGEVFGGKVALNTKAETLRIITDGDAIKTHYFTVYPMDYGYELDPPSDTKVTDEVHANLERKFFVGSILF